MAAPIAITAVLATVGWIAFKHGWRGLSGALLALAASVLVQACQ